MEEDRIMSREGNIGIDESTLTKGQLRKLNALRKSVGNEVGERAFSEWLPQQGTARSEADDNAAMIVDTLWLSTAA